MIKEKEIKNIYSHLKNYGFIISSSEIYQGFSNSWDLGINGTAMKMNLEKIWKKYFISSRPNIFFFDSSILTNPKVLEASGHLKKFHDWTIDCLNCQKRYRLDQIISEKKFENFLKIENKDNYLINKICFCGNKKFSIPKKFNLLLKTNLELTDKKEKIAYLRPETCQGIFINFFFIKKTIRNKFPFGIGQIGKSFRKEITLNHGIYRTIEFRQMELEFFCEKKEINKWWKIWNEDSWKFINKIIKNNSKKIKKKLINDENLPHYSKKTLDFYFNYNFGWGELCSISDRGNFDLKEHSNYSGFFLGIKKNNENIDLNIIELSFGVERIMLAILEDSYYEEYSEKLKKKRCFLKINPLLSPYFLAIIPINKKMEDFAYLLYLKLIKKFDFNVFFENSNSIGKSYHYQDSMGTFFCLTVDFNYFDKKIVTCRERDSTEQIILEEKNIINYFNNKYLNFLDEFLNFEKK